MSFHVLSLDYVRVRIVHIFSLFLRLHAGETFFHTIFLCLHVVSCPVSFYLHSGLDYFSFSIHIELDLFLVWTNLNHIYNTFFLSTLLNSSIVIGQKTGFLGIGSIIGLYPNS